MRQIISFNKDWLFIKHGISLEEACSSQGEKVDLPHTWNGHDGQDGGGDYLRGSFWYVKKFASPVLSDDQEVFLEFKGANAEAKVFLNGEEIGSHQGGYAAFRLAITDYLKEENVLAVCVSNAENKAVYPQSADFTFYGGLYRDVNLIIVEKEHFELLELGGLGLKADCLVEGQNGMIVAKTETTFGDQVSIEVFDAEGKKVGSGKPGENIIIENVHRWNGLADPYLYTVTANLFAAGVLKDSVSARVGFRSFYVDPKKGFFLNGRPYPLRGVARHQDRPDRGNAITAEDQEEDMALIREIGANTVRLSHYQHSDFFYDLCDKYGLVVWSEIPYISKHEDEGDANAWQQMEELIEQTYNHPSIFFRGLSNEITMKKAGPDRLAFHLKLNKMVKEKDPYRLTTMAAFSMCSFYNRLNSVSDVFSYNYYFGWYVPGTFLNSLVLDAFHLLRGKHSVGLSEYGAEGMPNLHSAKPKRFDNSEEYQASYHEKILKIISKRPYLWATHVWNMFDFGADGRNQGGDPGKNHKGLVTFDRKIKKDAFYIYKAYWSKEPFVHLCSQRFVNRVGERTDIKVYTNQKHVSLFVNGKLFKEKDGDKVFCFKIPLSEKTVVKAVSGSSEEEMTIVKAAKEDPSYKVKHSNSYSWEKKKGK